MGPTLRLTATGQNDEQVDRDGKDEDGHEGEREGRVDGTAQTGSVCEGELCDGCGEGLPGKGLVLRTDCLGWELDNASNVWMVAVFSKVSSLRTSRSLLLLRLRSACLTCSA
jgi:hypothetical protein